VKQKYRNEQNRSNDLLGRIVSPLTQFGQFGHHQGRDRASTGERESSSGNPLPGPISVPQQEKDHHNQHDEQEPLFVPAGERKKSWGIGSFMSPSPKRPSTNNIQPDLDDPQL
jgi:hypothetical protein